MRSRGSRAQALRLARGLAFSSCRIMVNVMMSLNCAGHIPSSNVVTCSFKHRATMCEYRGAEFLYEGIEQCGVCEMSKNDDRTLLRRSATV